MTKNVDKLELAILSDLFASVASYILNSLLNNWDEHFQSVSFCLKTVSKRVSKVHSETRSPGLFVFVPPNWLHIRSNLLPGLTCDKFIENKSFESLDSVRKKSTILTMQGATQLPGAFHFTTPSRNLRDTSCIKCRMLAT